MTSTRSKMENFTTTINTFQKLFTVAKLPILDFCDATVYASVTLSEATTRGVLQKSYSEKFLNIYRKTPVLESLLVKVLGLKYDCFIKK